MVESGVPFVEITGTGVMWKHRLYAVSLGSPQLVREGNYNTTKVMAVQFRS